MKEIVFRESIKQLPAVLASVALVISACHGCRKSETIADLTDRNQTLRETQTNLVEQIISVSKINAEPGEFE